MYVVFKSKVDSNSFLAYHITDKDGKVTNEFEEDVICTTSFIGFKTTTFLLKKNVNFTIRGTFQSIIFIFKNNLKISLFFNYVTRIWYHDGTDILS